MAEHPESDSLILAVFDGHGEEGHVVSQHFRAKLPDALFAHQKFKQYITVPDNVPPPGMPGPAPPFKTSQLPPIGPPRKRRDVASALIACLKQLEKELLADPSVDCSLSGCTGCVCVISGSEITVANIGDSRCILVRHARSPEGLPTFMPITVTIDHKPVMLSETKRILISGGRVQSIKYDDGIEGPVRVWLRNDDLPGLAMSRSLGDTIGKKAGVISTPDIYQYTLTSHDAFVLLASDGLWEFISSADATRVISKSKADADTAQAEYDREKQQFDIIRKQDPNRKNLEEPAQPVQLLQLALDSLATDAAHLWQEKEGVIDDTSIILAEIGCVHVQQTVFDQQ
jgi:serine/threonine protein phosphatase PrpC